MNYFIGMATLWEPLSMLIVYVWSRYNPEVIVNFMFGIKFRAIFLPAIMGCLEFLMTGDFYGPLFGIIAGHVYYFLTEIYGPTHNPRWRTRLQAPLWLKALIPVNKIGISSTGTSYQGFSVQRPEEAFGGKTSISGAPSTDKGPSSFKVFSGRGQKLGY